MLREIADILKISKRTEFKVVHENLCMKKFYYHFTPELKRASAEWRGEGESWPKRPKTQQSAGKVMAFIFWDMHGILLIDFLPKDQTINSDYYIALFDRLEDAI